MWIELHLHGTGERVLFNVNGIKRITEGHGRTAYIAVGDCSDYHVNESYDDVVSAIIRRNCGGVE